ncbi:MAG: hypothetical protein K2N81_11160 [Acetatifactor sp.]|nr:hypothetical protein [Acetatifactor sp.]
MIVVIICAVCRTVMVVGRIRAALVITSHTADKGCIDRAVPGLKGYI